MIDSLTVVATTLAAAALIAAAWAFLAVAAECVRAGFTPELPAEPVTFVPSFDHKFRQWKLAETTGESTPWTS